MAQGIETRHQRECRSREGGRCNCRPSYRVSVWLPREKKRIRKSFLTLAEARSWRTDALSAVNKGTLRAPSAATLKEAADAWLDAARTGHVRNRSGDPYKPSAIRGYEQALRLRVLHEFGTLKLSELRITDVQDFIDGMLADGLAPSTIDTTLNPLRAIYRRAMQRGEVSINPTRGVSLPANRSRRERIADPAEAECLLDALPVADRATWATAMYAGLRRGELRALDWEHVDLASGVIHVERSWDDVEGLIGLKSANGKRNVPIPAILRDHLDRLERREGYVFGNGRPFNPRTLTDHADDAWEEAGLDRITLHECRHSYASLMIAAGVNAKALSTYLGHANIAITFDRYGHLMPGNEGEAADLLDAYLGAATAAAVRASSGKKLVTDPHKAGVRVADV